MPRDNNRGNQTKEFINGILQKSFTFDATNMLSKVIDKDKGELENHYNGLGFRVASTRPEEKIEYLCDLSKDYYNLLERTVNGETESFVYDNNVISMSKSGNNFYYLQDELGSPMYMTGTDGAAVSAYAFDDYGRNIDPFTGNRRDDVHKHGYTKHGNIIQPFVFTGYQEDEVSGLKFAQARFYSAENGRFLGEDQIKGFIDSPESQNSFEYCRQNPIEYIDGKCPLLATAAIGAGAGFAIGGGIGLVSMLAEATVVSSTAASIMANCGRIVATASATIEAGRQIFSDENIDMFKVTSAGAAGAVSGMVTGSPIGYLGAGFMNAGISAVQSITNDIHDGKGGLEIAIDAGVYATIGFVGGLVGGSGAMNNMTHSAHITNVLFGMEQSCLSITSRLIVGRAAEDYLKRAIVMGIVKGIGWTLGVTASEKVYKHCVRE